VEIRTLLLVHGAGPGPGLFGGWSEDFYGADALDLGAATHWDLVLDPRVRRRIAEWLARPVGGGEREGLLGGSE
jgi:hypothetical protein